MTDEFSAFRSRTVYQQLRPLRRYLARYRRALVVGTLMLVLTNVVWMLFPRVVGAAIDALRTEFTRDRLLTFALLLVGIAVATGFFRFWMRWILIGVSRDIEYDLRNDLFRHLARQSSSFYSRQRTGDLMTRSTSDLCYVRMVLGPGIMYSANALIAFPLAIAWMVYLDWRLTLCVLVPVPIVSYAVKRFGQLIHERSERIQAKFSELTARVQENLAGVRLLRAFCQEKPEQRAFDRLNREFIEENKRLIVVQGLFWPCLEALLGVAFLLVLWLGGRSVLDGRITLGAFVAFTQYMLFLTWPMIALGWVVNLFERGAASMGRIDHLLTTEPAILDRATTGAPSEIRGEIEFRNLSFRYNGVPVLRNLNLKIAAGQTVAIVGPTGSGKSTLISLLPRLYDPPPGTLRIDGIPIEAHRLETLRQAIGFVPQETFLFSDTLRENIAFGVENASDEKIREAATIAGLAEDVQEFPRGYDTLVGERGLTLSGGQKQRTAISRALLRDPCILVLDDALSSVDTYTEEKILRRLSGVMRARTTILISHRVSTVRHADLIVVLKEGEVVERGTHEELLAQGGYYYDLYQKQLLEEELERA
ncbi:MAG: ABC transporter ATP-binding protein [Acidobacteria bacterium]|nr:ABC transporter ATP-binding protein [Acidobacteriota bacterium]